MLEADPMEFKLSDVIWARSVVIRDFQNRPYVSFLGKFSFEVSGKCRKALEVLIPMAEVSGVGAWRTSGFGRVKFYEGDNS